jgi:hypothetical protein
MNGMTKLIAQDINWRYTAEGINLAVSEIFREIDTFFNLIIAGRTEKKMEVFSSHGKLLVGMLYAFGLSTLVENDLMPFASSIVLELWDTGNKDTQGKPVYAVKTMYNDTAQKVSGCQNQDMCAFTDFETVLSSHFVADIAEACKLKTKTQTS